MIAGSRPPPDQRVAEDAKNNKGKVLILHGEEDKRTPVHQAEQLAAALQERGAAVTTRYFPEENHRLGPRAYGEVVEFLRQNLVSASASASG